VETNFILYGLTENILIFHYGSDISLVWKLVDQALVI